MDGVLVYKRNNEILWCGGSRKRKQQRARGSEEKPFGVTHEWGCASLVLVPHISGT
jgi:hypothetical protein